jgi:hypothetical protein
MSTSALEQMQCAWQISWLKVFGNWLFVVQFVANSWLCCITHRRRHLLHHWSARCSYQCFSALPLVVTILLPVGFLFSVEVTRVMLLEILGDI